MSVTPTTEHYDAIIIGTGQGGYPLAKALPQAGYKTAIIERGPVGGTCVNVGCTPTKTMIASGRVAYLARRAGDYGVQVGEILVNLAQVRRRKREIVSDFSDGSRSALESIANLDLIFGEASFLAPHTLAVRLNAGGQRRLSAERIIINTGTRPLIPPVSGLAQLPYLDNASIMELGELPERLLVLGGGYIGLEFGQLFRRLGSQVTIVQRGGQLLSREDPDVAEEILRIFREEEIEVQLNSEPIRAAQNPEGELILTLRTAEGERQLSGSHLLVATGRVPNSDTLNLSAAGIDVDRRGFIKANERLETNVPGIHVIGDVKGGPAFTHISYDDFRVLRTNLLEAGTATINDRLVPYTVFIDPQLGRVGLTEREARAQGREIRVAKLPMSYVARALEVDETRGFMKAIVDAESKQILGCAILGIEGGEVMSMLEIAMMGHLPYTALCDGIFAHPTLAEALNNLFSGLEA